jgi:sugar-specific transcriptional regulator TrmB
VEAEKLLRESFGLTTYEAKAYVSLLRRRMRAPEVASLSGIPLSRTYDTLRSLERKGFALESEGMYGAVKPATALKTRLGRYASDFALGQAERERAMQRIVAETGRLRVEKEEQKEPEMLRGIDSIAGAFLEVLRSSGHVILAVRKGVRTSSEFLGLIKGSRQRPRIRVLVSESAKPSAEEMAEARRLGVQVRKSPGAFLDLMVGDSGDVIMGVPSHGLDGGFGAVAVWVKDPSFSRSLMGALDRLWRDAAP